MYWSHYNGPFPSFLNTIECGPVPNVMAVLPNIGGALFSTPHLADAHYLTAVPRVQDAKAVEISWGAQNW